MRIHRSILCGILAFGVTSFSASASAQDRSTREDDTTETTDTSPVTEEVAETKVEKKVCRSIRVTGTRFRERICRTPSEWRAEQQATSESAEDQRRSDPNN